MKRTVALLLTLTACRSSPGAPEATQSATAGIHAPPLALSGHPRLWMRAADVPRLRGWARGGNPAWIALSQAAAHARDDMDGGKVRLDGACVGEGGTPCEEYAELSAFLSVVAPSDKERKDWGARAVKMLMPIIDHVAGAPPDDHDPLRSREFAVNDRSRWSGEAFALTVDWAYPYFSAAQKKRIHDVFLRWADQSSHAEVTNNNHPEPVGVVDDPRLVADKINVRWAGNNYYTAHARNLGLMAMALDAADDPGGQLGAYLKSVTGAWLYVIDALLRGDARGGLPPDGLEYGPQTYAYVAQLLLALHTAGKDDAATWGKQARMADNPWWKALVAGWPHLLSPATERSESGIGTVYRPAWWGEAQDYWAPDPIDMLGPVAIYFRDRGDHATADAAQWIAVNSAPGGADALADRVRGTDTFRRSILPFLMIDPTRKPPADPRRGTTWFAEGLGKIFQRTDWSAKATLFDFMIGWNSVDHMHDDANTFDWYRRGEWLVKER
ncbi:MAG TPA: hypothetical protein VLU41_05675, partial [Ideonella sp.]|nr:hypothetical protein [Ideonella sp.]